MLHAGMSTSEREKVVNGLTSKKDNFETPIITYAVGGYGSNLQSLCWRVFMCDTACPEKYRHF